MIPGLRTGFECILIQLIIPARHRDENLWPKPKEREQFSLRETMWSEHLLL